MAERLAASLSRTYQVILAGRSSPSHRVDLGWEWDKIRIPEGVELVVNLALAQPVDQRASAVWRSLEENIAGPVKLYKASISSKVSHFIQVSSIYANWKPWDDRNSRYATEKRVADEMLSYLSLGAPTLWSSLRVAALHGPGDFHRESQPFLWEMGETARRGEPITLEGDGRHLRSYLHVDDFCEIVNRVAQQRVSGLWDCPGEQIDYRQVAEIMLGMYGNRSPIQYSYPCLAPLCLVPDMNESLYSKLDFFPFRRFADLASSRESLPPED